jgi:DNA-binding transcriptional MerR regulator
MPMAELPDGQESFKLNEVCKLANVQPYMLRFWGTEFSQLETSKSGTGQRTYTRDQVELILEIRRLLFDEGLTIAGARKRIDSGGGEPQEGASRATKGAKRSRSTAPDAAAVRREVDKLRVEVVKPLLATLEGVRRDLADITAELRG